MTAPDVCKSSWVGISKWPIRNQNRSTIVLQRGARTLRNLFDIDVDVYFPIFDFYGKFRMDRSGRCLMLAAFDVKLPPMPRAGDNAAL